MSLDPPNLKSALRMLTLFPRFSRWAATRVPAHGGDRLSLRQFAVMAAIRAGVQSPGEIAGRLLVTPAVVTGLIDRLEEQGYVRRDIAESDRRRQCLLLTAAGQAICEGVQQGLARELCAQLEDAGAAELAALERVLERLERAVVALERHAEQGGEGPPHPPAKAPGPRSRGRA